MKPRQTLILGIVVALLIIGILSYHKLYIPYKEKSEQVQAFPEFSPDMAARIEICRGEYKAELVKRDGQWIVATEGDYPADEEGINEGLDMVKGLPATELISRNPEQRDRFELTDEKGVRVKILSSDSRPIAEFLIGKQGSAYNSYYFRKAGEDNIYLAYEDLLDTFNREHDTWRDRSIFDFEKEEAREISIQSEQGEIILTKNLEKDTWELLEGENRIQAKKWTVDDMVSTLSRLKTQEFSELKDLKKIGLHDPKKRITVKLADGSEPGLLFGDEKESSSQIYVKKADSPTIFLIGKYQMNKFFKKRDELIEDKKQEGKKEKESLLPPPQLEQTTPVPQSSPAQ